MEPDRTHSSFTSQTLLGRVRDLSDQQAWDEFVQTYAPRIFSWCKRNSLQDQDASDVTQDVLMKLVSAMEQFEYLPSRGTFRGWLKTVTTNAVRDLARRRSSTELTGPGADEWLGRLTEPDSIDALTQRIEEGYRQELLTEAESRVSLRVKPTTWEAYRLSANGMSAPDVAQKLGIKVADVYVAKSRTLKLLKETIEQLEE